MKKDLFNFSDFDDNIVENISEKYPDMNKSEQKAICEKVRKRLNTAEDFAPADVVSGVETVKKPIFRYVFGTAAAAVFALAVIPVAFKALKNTPDAPENIQESQLVADYVASSTESNEKSTTKIEETETVPTLDVNTEPTKELTESLTSAVNGESDSSTAERVTARTTAKPGETPPSTTTKPATITKPVTTTKADVVASGNYGAEGANVKWTLDSKGTLTFSGKGAIKDFIAVDGPEPPPMWRGNENVKEIVIENGITRIGDNVFDYCTEVESITIPDSVTSIGTFAFNNCSKLESITIPDSVISIDSMAFALCSGLKTITIPDSVTTLGEDAFFYCTNLTSVKLSNNLECIEDATFFFCESLESVEIGNKVKSIENSAFACCFKLKDVTLPESVNYIGDGAFFRCQSLDTITIENPDCEFFDTQSIICNEYDSSTDAIIADFTIIGKAGSTAEEHAKKHGIAFKVIGIEYEEPKTEIDWSFGDFTDNVWSITYSDYSKVITNTDELREYLGKIYRDEKVEQYLNKYNDSYFKSNVLALKAVQQSAGARSALEIEDFSVNNSKIKFAAKWNTDEVAACVMSINLVKLEIPKYMYVEQPINWNIPGENEEYYNIRIKEIEEYERQNICTMVRERAILNGEMADINRLTFKQAEEIIKENGTPNDIYDSAYAERLIEAFNEICDCPDIIGGSGITRYEYWLGDSSGSEKVIIYLEQPAVWHESKYGREKLV